MRSFLCFQGILELINLLVEDYSDLFNPIFQGLVLLLHHDKRLCANCKPFLLCVDHFLREIFHVIFWLHTADDVPFVVCNQVHLGVQVHTSTLKLLLALIQCLVSIL